MLCAFSSHRGCLQREPGKLIAVQGFAQNRSILMAGEDNPDYKECLDINGAANQGGIFGETGAGDGIDGAHGPS